MREAVVDEGPFAVMQVKAAWSEEERSLLTFTSRAWNVFQNQVEEGGYNNFPWPMDVSGNALMTVVRHEVAHQFDRMRDENMMARFNAYRALATKVSLTFLKSLSYQKDFSFRPKVRENECHKRAYKCHKLASKCHKF